MNQMRITEKKIMSQDYKSKKGKDNPRKGVAENLKEVMVFRVLVLN